jgi:hypothetical protein
MSALRRPPHPLFLGHMSIGSVAKFVRSQIVHDGGAFMLPFGTRRKRRLLELSFRFHLPRF